MPELYRDTLLFRTRLDECLVVVPVEVGGIAGEGPAEERVHATDDAGPVRLFAGVDAASRYQEISSQAISPAGMA